MYTIIDIETTGGNNKSGRITEIAAFLHDGHKLIDKFSTLINPGIPIPPFIKKLTGITDEMVADAPTFAEISAELDRFTANSIFVAHNVNFDYSFIKEEFRRIGRDFKRKTLCTVQLSRHSFPGLESYSLGKITAQLDIGFVGHHRAEADARATVHLFEKIIHNESQTGLFDAHFGVPDLDQINSPYITRAFLDAIPDECGVARFYNREDALIYIKRSPQILTAICSRLRSNGAQEHKEFLEEVYRIEAELTGSALLAQLMEVNEVLGQKPKYNHGKFSMKAHYALFIEEINGEKVAALKRRRAGRDAKMVFGSFFEGLDYLKKLSLQKGYELSTADDFNNGKQKTPVMHVQGFPIEKVLPAQSAIIIDDALNVSERVAIILKKGMPVGYALLDVEEPIYDFPEENLKFQFSNYPEMEMVIRTFLAKDRFEKIIELKH